MSYNYLSNIKQNILNILYYENNRKNKIYNININFGLWNTISSIYMFRIMFSIINNISITFIIIINISNKRFYMDGLMLER
nr:MAG TPA_asm: hypothetical protein [Bacteriophage sp.]